MDAATLELANRHRDAERMLYSKHVADVFTLVGECISETVNPANYADYLDTYNTTVDDLVTWRGRVPYVLSLDSPLQIDALLELLCFYWSRAISSNAR